MFDCLTVLSVPCSLVVTCWERAGLLALLYVMCSWVFNIFPYGVVWCLIVSIPDLGLLPYFISHHTQAVSPKPSNLGLHCMHMSDRRSPARLILVKL